MWVAAFVFCLAFPSLALAETNTSECDEYLEVSHQLRCSERGYLRTFGHRYCREFIERDSEFSPSGRKVLARIRSCLLEKISTDPSLTCRNVKSRAEDHHVECYLSSGYCDMYLADQLKIAEIVWQEMIDPGFKDASLRILEGCQVL